MAKRETVESLCETFIRSLQLELELGALHRDETALQFVGLSFLRKRALELRKAFWMAICCTLSTSWFIFNAFSCAIIIQNKTKTKHLHIHGAKLKRSTTWKDNFIFQ